MADPKIERVSTWELKMDGKPVEIVNPAIDGERTNARRVSETLSLKIDRFLKSPAFDALQLLDDARRGRAVDDGLGR